MDESGEEEQQQVSEGSESNNEDADINKSLKVAKKNKQVVSDSDSELAASSKVKEEIIQIPRSIDTS